MRILRWLSPRLWLAALILALVLVAADTVSRIRQVESVSAIHGEMVDPPAPDPTSPTGYSLGRRTLIVPGSGGDAYHWIVQTQMMLAGSGWRIRHVDYDNAPSGREVHWASPYRWWLGALAWFDHATSGQPLGAAVDWAALRSNPLLLGVLLLGLIPLVARRFGSIAAAIMAIGMATAFPFNAYFAADYPDHHGILEACGMLTVLFLLAGGSGFVRSTAAATPSLGADERELMQWLSPPGAARAWFTASAIAGGIGMWVSAASEIPVLVGVGLGAVWSGWMGRVPAPGGAWRHDPTLWRWWGRVGGGVSLAAYLVEYFPSHLGFRLEVNHPLYALAWLGAGELLCRYFQRVGSPERKLSRRDVIAAMAATVAVGLAPVVILLTKDRTFAVADRFVWQLGPQYVAEGESIFLGLARNGFGWLALAHFLPLLLIVPPLWLVLRRKGARVWKAPLALAVVPALLFLFLTIREIRWWGLEIGLLFAALGPVFVSLGRTTGSRYLQRWIAAGCGLLLLPGVADLVRTVMHPAPADIHQLVERDLAHWIRQRAGTDRVVVASSPGITTQMIYFGNCTGLGTLYWENTEGIKHTAAIFAARTAEEAHELVRRFGVTHLVLPTWDHFPEDIVRFDREVPPTDPVPSDAFIRLILRGAVPPWLRLIPYRLPPVEALAGQSVLVYEVVPKQSPAAAAAHLMDYLLELDQAGPAAAAAARQLQRYPSDLPAQVMLAYFQGRTGQTEAYAATLERVRADLPQATTLDVEDRIRLAYVLAASQQTELAQVQLREAVRQLDEHSLRRLTPGTLGDLLRLMHALRVEIPDPRLRQLAPTLYPPMLRQATEGHGA